MHSVAVRWSIAWRRAECDASTRATEQKAQNPMESNFPYRTISIQRLEEKETAFLVGLRVDAAADKGAIETEMKRLYQSQVRVLEVQYEERLRLQGAHLRDKDNRKPALTQHHLDVEPIPIGPL